MNGPAPTRPSDPGALSPPKWLEAVQRALEKLQYGQVVLTVHQGEVIQVDRTERLRLPSGKRG